MTCDELAALLLALNTERGVSRQGMGGRPPGAGEGKDRTPALDSPGGDRLAQHLDFHAVTTLSRRRLVIVTTGNEDKDPDISIYIALPRNFWAVFSLSPGPWMFEDPALLASASLSRHPMALLPTALAPSPRLPAASPRLCTCESLWRLRLDVF